MTLFNEKVIEKAKRPSNIAKNSVVILVITFFAALFATQMSQAASLISDDNDWAMFAGLMSEYSEFGDAEQVLLAEGHFGVQFTDPYQGLALALYGKSSVSDFTPIGGQYNALGVTVEYLYQPYMTGFFSGGANLGLSLAGDDTALHTELFGRYRVTVNNWLQAGAQAGYRLAPNHSLGDQEMKGFNLALFFNFGNF